MCGRSMYCNTCRLALVIRLCRVASSLLPWLGSHDLSSATVQRSSGAAAIGDLQKKKQLRGTEWFVKLKEKGSLGRGTSDCLWSPATCWLAGQEHQRRF